ncbi:MAG TPA: F420-0--gamma-glutamyl ligase [Peptococcaceae bacterium]|nr:F420-0--gamma-glutamyl ligase [Peptococcaceae bacterium]
MAKIRTVGTTVRGIRAPIAKEGDDLVKLVVDSVLQSAEAEGYELRDRDVIGITESIVARTQGNYVDVEDIAQDISRKFTGDIAVLFPILSRNRFSLILKGIALSGRKIYLFLNYPSDEVGNSLMDIDLMDEKGLNPYIDVLKESEYRQLFGARFLHPFTGIDYVQLYKDLAVNNNIEIYLANDPRVALQYTKEILVANIHERKRTKKILLQAGAERVYGLDEILTEPVNGSGFNPDYGLLGSNKATENSLKLFPRDCQPFVDKVQEVLYEKTGKKIEVLVYGDGAFKDPRGKIWELADPVVSPGYTSGLIGTPNEIKIKYIADNELANLEGKAKTEAMKQKIRAKHKNLVGRVESLGTTPRQLTDLLGSLCDLTSGSGDKGTPIVLIQGYFDDYATE